MFYSVKRIIFVFCTLWSSFVVYNLSNFVNNEELIENFEKNSNNSSSNNVVNEVVNNNQNMDKENVVMTLSIPKLNINNKIYSKDSTENNIDKNVQLMSMSDMPDFINGNVILGGHSGTGKLAYFKRLNELVVGDFVVLNYKEKDFVYRIVNSYIDDKDGHIVISRNLNKNSITLFTCNPNDKNNYLVIIGELV